MLFSIALILSSGMCAAGLLYAVRKIAFRSPQDCQAQSAGLLSVVEVTLLCHANGDRPLGPFDRLRDPFRAQGSFSGSGILGCRRVALRSPQDCQAQSTALLYAVRRVAERSRSNTAFQLPRFTFSTGPFDRLRDPFRA